MITLNAHQRAVLLMILTPTLWSIAGVITRYLQSAQGFEITFWRSVFCGLFVAAVLVIEQGWDGMWRGIRNGGKAGLVSGLMWSVMFTCFMIALIRTTVANTLIVMSVAPLLTALLAWAVLRERIAGRTWLAIAVAFAGMVWMFRQGVQAEGGRHLSGMLIAAMVPMAAAINLITIKRTGQGVDLVPAVLLGSVFSALLMLPFAWPLQASLHDVSWLAVLGVFQLGLPCLLMVRAMRHLSAQAVSLLALLEVVLGPLWVWVGAGEVPGQETLVGGAVVIGALVLHEVAGLRRQSGVGVRQGGGASGLPPSRDRQRL